MMGRIWAVFKARNIEFVRDRASMAWAILMPFALVLGLSFIFSGDDSSQFTVGTIDADLTSEHAFLQTRFTTFVPVTDVELAIQKIGRHELDLLVEFAPQVQYWVNPDSPSGYIVERLLLQSDSRATRRPVSGDAIRYIDWLVPGILGMNMMFSCLFGVGYVVVRYRKNGFLKRLQATPLNAFEFITAQAMSRLALTLTVQSGVFVGVKALLGIPMNGSYLALLTIAFVGCSALISLALVFAARIDSEELAGGIVNIVAFPMVLLSGVFYSLEGSAEWLQQIANTLPLTQMLSAAREIIIDGGGFLDVAPQIAVLVGMSAIFLAIGASTFKWRSS
jgi:ABC-2 type transport system permease protein